MLPRILINFVRVLQESHIHSLINVIRYCQLDDSPKGEPGLVANEGLKRIFETKELDYLTHVVLRMYENTAVPLDDSRRFRIELMFSSGAALSPLEVSIFVLLGLTLCHWTKQGSLNICHILINS